MLQVQIELQYVYPGFAEDAESALGDMPGQHRSDALRRDAARRCHSANLQNRVSRADVRVEPRRRGRQHVGGDRLAGKLGFGSIESLAIRRQALHQDTAGRT